MTSLWLSLMNWLKSLPAGVLNKGIGAKVLKPRLRFFTYFRD